MNKSNQLITFHHFDDEPFRIAGIPGTLLNLMALRWPAYIQTYDLTFTKLNGSDCQVFKLNLDASLELHIRYIFYTNEDAFAINRDIAAHDVVLLDLMRPGENGLSLEKKGIDCFKHARQFITPEQIFVVSAYTYEFILEKGSIQPLIEQCYSKPINMRKLCEHLIRKVEQYVL